MAKYRVPVFIIIVISILSATWILIQIGNGYRPNIKNGSIQVTNTGLLVANSQPEGAQVLINQELNTATNDTISLSPGEYDVEIKKDGFIPWKKKISIESSIVIQTNAFLFPIVPDLKAITYTGAINPELAPNGTRIVYAVNEENPSTSSSKLTDTKTGIWLLELTDLPLGFSRDPKQIVSGPIQDDWQNCKFIWSYDSRQIITLCQSSIAKVNTLSQKTPSPSAKINTIAYLIDINQQQKSSNLTNITNSYSAILDEWQIEQTLKTKQQLINLKSDLNSLISTVASEINFSPDETKILYIATASATLKDNYIDPILAASSQSQTRILQPNKLYLYDTKEDRNFLIDATPATTSAQRNTKYQWFPTSRHLIKSTPNQISIIEYDNTNEAVIYSGNITSLDVFPHPSDNKLIIATTLNPVQAPIPNLYTLIFR